MALACSAPLGHLDPSFSSRPNGKHDSSVEKVLFFLSIMTKQKTKGSQIVFI
jgi:hypothetical protein